MNLSDVIKIWDIIHTNDLRGLDFCDLEKAIDKVVGVKNDIDARYPYIARRIESPDSLSKAYTLDGPLG